MVTRKGTRNATGRTLACSVHPPSPMRVAANPDCERCADYEMARIVSTAEQIVGGESLDADSAPTPQ